MSDRDLECVRYAVHSAMDAWERLHPTGSARPAFEHAWRDTCLRQRYAGTVLDREQIWRTWLAGGRPLTRAREVELLEAAGPGAAKILRELGIPRREPGCDDDLP